MSSTCSLHILEARCLASVVHGAAKRGLGIGSASLFEALSNSRERRFCEFIAQPLTNAAYTSATASQSDTASFAALARAVGRRLGKSIAQELGNTA